MSEPQLAIFGYSEAAMFLRKVPAPNITAIISIHGAREFAVELDHTHRLDLRFDDVEAAIPNDVKSLQRAVGRNRWAKQNGLVEIAPVVSDAAAIIEFAQGLRDTNGFILCHCGGGMSRAPAAALIALSVWRGPGTETECVAEVLALRRGAVPHLGLIRFADDLLGRKGQLVGALSE